MPDSAPDLFTPPLQGLFGSTLEDWAIDGFRGVFQGLTLRFNILSQSSHDQSPYQHDLDVFLFSEKGPWSLVARLPIYTIPFDFEGCFAILAPFLQAQVLIDLRKDWIQYLVSHGFHGRWDLYAHPDGLQITSLDGSLDERQQQSSQAAHGMPFGLRARLLHLQHCLIPQASEPTLCRVGHLDVVLPSVAHERLAILHDTQV